MLRTLALRLLALASILRSRGKIFSEKMQLRDTYKAQLKHSLSDNHLEEVADSIVETLGRNQAQGATELSNDAINLLGRLKSVKRDYRNGLVSRQQYDLEENNIRAALNDIIDDIKPEWLPEDREQPSAVHKPPLRAERDPLDQVFKLLILLLCLISIGLLIYSTLFIQHRLEDKLPHMVLSIVGGSGAFYGYMKWRIIELRIS